MIHFSVAEVIEPLMESHIEIIGNFSWKDLPYKAATDELQGVLPQRLGPFDPGFGDDGAYVIPIKQRPRKPGRRGDLDIGKVQGAFHRPILHSVTSTVLVFAGGFASAAQDASYSTSPAAMQNERERRSNNRSAEPQPRCEADQRSHGLFGAAAQLPDQPMPGSA
jgi:hypothetical protein